MASSSSKVSVVDSSFYSNEAERGAVIAAILQSISIFTNIFPCTNLTNKKLTINCRESEIQIIDNRAEFGGAIYLSESKNHSHCLIIIKPHL